MLGRVPSQTGLEKQGSILIPASWIPCAECFAVTLGDNSLIGDCIYAGDTLLVERNTEIIDGKIYIIRYENNNLARHIYKTGNKLSLVSTDGSYTEIGLDSVEILGRVVGSFQYKER